MAHALRHAEVVPGLMFVHKRFKPCMEVTNVPELLLSLKAATFKSAQASFVLNDCHINHVTLRWFIFIHNNILIVIYLYFS